MKKRIIVLGFFILAFCITVIVLMTRRTPYSITKTLFDLDLNKEYKVELFKDEWAPNGDGESLVVFSYSSIQEDSVIQFCNINK